MIRIVLSLLTISLLILFLIEKPELKAKTANENLAPHFELKDQYDKSASYKFPKQKVTVLTFGDRKGSEQIEGWVKPLWDRYQTRIDQQGVAVLTSVPFFARGFVRSIFKSKVKYPVLLDWKGDVAKAYSYQNGKANVYVIDRNGQIIMKLTGAANQTELNRLFARIDALL